MNSFSITHESPATDAKSHIEIQQNFKHITIFTTLNIRFTIFL